VNNESLSWMLDLLVSAKFKLEKERDLADHSKSQSIRSILCQVDAALLMGRELMGR